MAQEDIFNQNSLGIRRSKVKKKWGIVVFFSN